MKLSEERIIEEYRKKKAFIDALNPAFEIANDCVDYVELDIFGIKSEEGEHEWIEEFIVVHFRGGAISVRNVAINSDFANFQELGRLIMGGYYSEVERYRELKTKAIDLGL